MVNPRRNFFKGHEYMTILRETSTRDRHGDYSTEVEEIPCGPCSLAWGSDWGSTSERRVNVSALTERDLSAYFNDDPGIRLEDKVRTVHGKRYRVISIERWRFRGSGAAAGWVVTMSGIESEG